MPGQSGYKNMMLGRRAAVVALVLMYGACGPDAVVDPTLTDGSSGSKDARDVALDRASDVSGGGGGTGGGGAGGTGGGGSGGGGSGGASGSGGTPVDMAVDQPVDQRVVPPDMMFTPDVIDAPPARMAVLVVGNDMTLTAADMQWRTSLMGRGLTPQVVDDGAAAAVTGAALVVIAASSDSNAVATKYRDVPVPVMVIEPAAFDNMGMTSGGDNYGQDNGTQITISMAGHPMAAGLSGNVPVLTMAATLCWGMPAAAAQRVASFTGMTGRATIFGYAKGAAMVMGTAPARRVGFFAGEPAASRLTENGKKLVDAAIDWALLP
jgi:hypothetical protein